jgi:beta-lactamase class A
MQDLEALLDDEAAGFAGRVGYAITNTSTREHIERRGDELFPTASAIKLPILTAFHSFVESGGASWEDSTAVDRELSRGGSGILQSLSVPELLYRDAAWLMICLSDNLATNLLLRTMSLEGTNRLIHELIDENITVNNYAGFQPGPNSGSMGKATPAALGRYLDGLVDGRLPGASETIDVARQQFYQSSIPRYLPLDVFEPDAPGAVQIAHKGGSMPGVRSDIAVLSLGETTVTMAVMTADADDKTGTPQNEGERCIGRIARLVYDAWLAG